MEPTIWRARKTLEKNTEGNHILHYKAISAMEKNKTRKAEWYSSLNRGLSEGLSENISVIKGGEGASKPCRCLRQDAGAVVLREDCAQ